MRLGFSLFAMLFVLGACSSGSTPSPSLGGALPARLVADIVTDAASRAGVERDAVTVVSAEARTWSDGSLGCPEPGMYYTQALVDGYQVIVSVGGKEYDYRAAGGGFRLCEPGASAS
jgi:hypothetical protein